MVVPSKALADPGELDRALTASLTSNITEGFVTSATAVAGGASNVVQVGDVVEVDGLINTPRECKQRQGDFDQPALKSSHLML